MERYDFLIRCYVCARVIGDMHCNVDNGEVVDMITWCSAHTPFRHSLRSQPVEVKKHVSQGVPIEPLLDDELIDLQFKGILRKAFKQ